MEWTIQWDMPEQADRPKRAQVGRACAWCRVNRVRCDNRQPCRNCQKRRQPCQRDKTEPLTLPVALRKIEELKSQVVELKSQLQSQTSVGAQHESEQPLKTDYGRVGEPSWSRGFLTKSSAQISSQFYGLSSLRNFINQLKLHLHLAYGWVYSDEELQPKPVTIPFSKSKETTASPASIEFNDGVYMHKAQEEECLRLFWQSYHCAIPILDERDFHEHHSTLWMNRLTSNTRADSPLVDIILAICIQFGMTHVQRTCVSPGVPDDSETSDPSNAGRWYFQRSQSLLKADLEQPSITQLQCQILSVVYLRDASLFNMALSAVAGAAQTAYALGLHLEPNESYDRHERELRKRLWCMVFNLESKMNMDYGRPFLTKHFDMQFPGDDHELASTSSEMFVPFSKLKITWLSYHLHHVRLICAGRGAYQELSDRRAHFLCSNDARNFSQDDQALKTLDDFLTKILGPLKLWLEDVPEELQCSVHSTAATPELVQFHIEFDQHAPRWLQRQRIMLRLLYHDISINLCRSFILFPSPDNPFSSASTANSRECLMHSIAVTDIVHQVLQHTDILHGWHRAYQFQWNAAISMIGFAFSNRDSALKPLVLTEIEKALMVLDAFGRSFAIALSAGQIIRELHTRLLLIDEPW